MIREVEGVLPVQVFWGAKPDPKRMDVPRLSDHPRWKPGGGLWTSTFTPDQPAISDWAKWCDANECQEFLHNREPWLLTPTAARLILIEDYDDLRTLVRQYPAPNRYQEPPEYPAWFALYANGYDGVHLTEEGQWATRLSHPENLYGWDCESTLWFRWCFDDVRLFEYRKLAIHRRGRP